jgi:hypothetical protein
MGWHAQRNIILSNSSRSGCYAPKMFDAMPKEKREGFNETWFYRAMVSLFDQGKIKLADARKSHHKTQILVIA